MEREEQRVQLHLHVVGAVAIASRRSHRVRLLLLVAEVIVVGFDGSDEIAINCRKFVVGYL
jgi:hypothetical protein